MEDIRIDNEKLNKDIKNDLPEVPRKEDGSIDLEKIRTGTSKRNNAIVSDEIFNAYFRELPNNVENTSGTWRTTPSGGKIKILGGDPENDKEIWKAGAETLNATKAQRRTFAEIIEETLTKKAANETIEDLELTEDTDHLTAIIAAAVKRAERGDVKAMEFIRDTIGQKPTEKIEQAVDICTKEEADDLRGLLEDIKAGNA